MKKVLILAYDFPPYVSVGGLRPYSWYKYFNEYGVYPIVITRQWSNEYKNYLDYIAPSESDETIIGEKEFGTLIRTPYTPNISNRILEKYGNSKHVIIRKIFSAYFEFMQYFINIGPKIELYRAAEAYLKNNSVDFILTSGEPFILFRYAAKLSNKYNIPWIADYRDPWSQDKKRSYDFITKFLNTYWEKKYVKKASFISTVSPFFKRKIQTLFPFKRIEIIPNGYDPDAVTKTASIKQNSEVLRIGFVGTIYKWHPLEIVLQTYLEFIESIEDPKIELRFYGINNHEEIRNLILIRYNKLSKYVSIIPKMQNEALLANLAQDNMLLLFNYFSYMGTKIYDYLALRRKILLCFTNDPEGNKLKEKYYNIEDNFSSTQVQVNVIAKTNSGVYIEDSNQLFDELHQLYKEFKETGNIKCESKDIEQFSRKIQAKRMCDCIIENC